MKTYDELLYFSTFKDRYEYLKVLGNVGEETFGFDRYLNQNFYSSKEWRDVRRDVILRDLGCDMGLSDYAIHGKIVIHHINPITLDDVLKKKDNLIDPNNLICVSNTTHRMIHYGSSDFTELFVERKKNDTTLW